MLGWNGIILSFMGSSWKMIRSKSLSKMFKMSFKDKKSCSKALSQAASKRTFPISFFFTKARIPAQIGRLLDLCVKFFQEFVTWKISQDERKPEPVESALL